MKRVPPLSISRRVGAQEANAFLFIIVPRFAGFRNSILPLLAAKYAKSCGAPLLFPPRDAKRRARAWTSPVYMVYNESIF
ncbi:MAG: hypothetical protein MR935_01320 [Agathobaculum sp.]|nr:hypothetical protein [Agathobaculum sp.]